MAELGTHVDVEAMIDENQLGFAGWETPNEDVSRATSSTLDLICDFEIMETHCGSQCTQPHRNICAEKRSIISVMTWSRDRPSPPLPSLPFHQSRFGFNFSSHKLLLTTLETSSGLGDFSGRP